MQQIIDFISRFTKISEEEQQALEKIFHFSSLKKQEFLLREGEIPQKVAFLLKGAVRAYYTDVKGTEHTIALLLENEPLALFENFVLQIPSSISAVTVEPSELVWVSHSAFFDFLHLYPRYESVLRIVLSQGLLIESEHTKLLRIDSSRERYETLLSLRPELIQRIPLKYIASYLKMALGTLSKVRARKL